MENYIVYFSDDEYLCGYDLSNNSVTVTADISEATKLTKTTASWVAERVGAKFKELPQDQ
ncbi:hypothetical protein EauM23_00046 [Exiguobacterium phage vB_EauM-23]|nr:hypothetical protein EauM23_00046 [Exiguobacterium phage vB_EauM-23]